MKKLSIIAAAVLLSLSTFGANHCEGTTKKGEPCKSTFVIKGTKYCRLHNPNAVHCSFSKNGKACKMVVKNNGDMCRFHVSK